jgi:hypothetical protein
MALGAARENAEAGNAKAERYAYRVADGIVAVAFYVMSTGSSCISRTRTSGHEHS